MPDALKKAFRKLAMECHPDRNPGDKTAEQRFKELNEAYDVLKDDQKRAAYDRFGHAAFENGGMGRGGGAARASPARRLRLHRHLRRDVRRVHGRRTARPGRPRPRRRPALQHGDHPARRPSSGKQATIRVPHARSPARLQRHAAARRARSRSPARPATATARSARPRASSPSSAPAPACHGAGKVIEKPCRTCKRRRPHRQGEDAAGRPIPRRCRGRHPHPPGRRRRGRDATAAPAGDLYIFLSRRGPPPVPARGRQRPLPRAHLR